MIRMISIVRPLFTIRSACNLYRDDPAAQQTQHQIKTHTKCVFFAQNLLPIQLNSVPARVFILLPRTRHAQDAGQLRRKAWHSATFLYKNPDNPLKGTLFVQIWRPFAAEWAWKILVTIRNRQDHVFMNSSLAPWTTNCTAIAAINTANTLVIISEPRFPSTLYILSTSLSTT